MRRRIGSLARNRQSVPNDLARTIPGRLLERRQRRERDPLVSFAAKSRRPLARRRR
jgi:hypothetical protein